MGSCFDRVSEINTPKCMKFEKRKTAIVKLKVR